MLITDHAADSFEIHRSENLNPTKKAERLYWTGLLNAKSAFSSPSLIPSHRSKKRPNNFRLRHRVTVVNSDIGNKVQIGYMENNSCSIQLIDSLLQKHWFKPFVPVCSWTYLTGTYYVQHPMQTKLVSKLLPFALAAGCLLGCNSTDKSTNQSTTDSSTSVTRPDTVINTESVMEHPTPPPQAK